ncbi:alginate export family protein [Sphingomonas hengshuiensis]|uniref:alginate export family protein n=1 Tax=Sphingomonas hengshuiensis TaxID=1609977 RepID=UPI000AE642EF|nr:alginate export family protein [Sphingomonas hengshuiensis]
MYPQPPRLTALCLSLLAATAAPELAQAQTKVAAAEAAPASTDAQIIVIGLARGQDGAMQQTPPAQPGTPPSERTPERAPANPAIRSYPRQADGHGIKLSGYNTSRWAEDWRGMRDPKKRDDILDRLKYLPIDADGDAYVTLSGEMRLRTTLVSNPGLVDSPYRREDLLRLVGGADVHVGPFRAYGELAHGGLAGVNYGTPAGKSRNTLIVQQAFGELGGPVGRATLGIRYGRQCFTDGSPQILAIRDDNSILFVEQGVRAWAQLSRFRVDMFDFHHVTLGTGGTGDDVADKSTRFSGVTGGIVLADSKTRKLFLDPYAWRERNSKARWGSTTAREVRRHWGARLWGSLNDLTIDWTLDRQTGDFAGRDIDAWSAYIAQTYQLSRKGLAPKIGVHVDYGSGGGAYDKGALHNGRFVTGGAIAYSYQGALSPSNLVQISPNVTISPAKTLDLTTEYQRSYRATESDAVYKGNGTAYTGTQKIAGSHIGDAIRFQASWKIAPRVSLITRYEYFQPAGPLAKVKTTGSHYLSSWISLRF